MQKQLQVKKHESKAPRASAPHQSELSESRPSELAPQKFDKTNPYYEVLNQVLDPEVGVGIVDMGLIYNVKNDNGLVKVQMTLTSMGCPAGPTITMDIDGILRMQPDVSDVEIDVVWDPPWTPDAMNPEIRQMLFGGV